MSSERAAHVKHDQLLARIPLCWRLGIEDLNVTTLHNLGNVLPTLLSASERQITGCKMEQLLREIHQGHLTSREVLDAFSHRASLAHQFVCSLFSYSSGIR